MTLVDHASVPDSNILSFFIVIVILSNQNLNPPGDANCFQGAEMLALQGLPISDLPGGAVEQSDSQIGDLAGNAPVAYAFDCVSFKGRGCS